MKDVLAVVVTYGERFHLCSATIDAALAAGAGSVLVVANGSDPGPLARSSRTEGWAGRVRVVSLPENVGSAGGFHVGMALASETEARWIWLLDDDNVADSGALEALLEAVATSPMRVGCALRPSDPNFAERVTHDRSEAPAGSFLHFDLWSRLRRGSTGSRIGQLRTAPYGGMLVPTAALRIVQPMPAFVLYEDDTRFSRDLTVAGYELVGVPAATIADADAKWSGDRINGVSRLFSAADPTRVYYGVRNRTYIDAAEARSAGRRARFALNATVFVAMRLVLELPALRRRTVRAAVRGMRDGLAGRLGVHADYGVVGKSTKLSMLTPAWRDLLSA